MWPIFVLTIIDGVSSWNGGQCINYSHIQSVRIFSAFQLWPLVRHFNTRLFFALFFSRSTIHFHFFSSLFSVYSTLPNPMKSTNVAYKNQPGKIENFTPGHSSATDKERREVGVLHFLFIVSMQVPKYIT